MRTPNASSKPSKPMKSAANKNGPPSLYSPLAEAIVEGLEAYSAQARRDQA